MSGMFYWSRRKVTRVVRKKVLDCLALKCSSLVQIACPATHTPCWVVFCSWSSWHTQMIQPVHSRKRLAKPKCGTTMSTFLALAIKILQQMILCNRCNSIYKPTQSLRDSRGEECLQECPVLLPICLSRQAGMDQNGWQTISIMA